jgi:betaine-aldehyde dehydrogenase
VVAQAFADAGLPPGVLNIVAADRDVSETLVRHPGVDVISFTGSTAAGKIIGAICGAKVQRAHLELGGKSAAIILEDAAIGEAIPKAISGGMLLNNGQACAAWTRILVPDSRYDEMVEAMCDYLRTVKMGDPFDESMDIGPLAAKRQRDRVESYIELAQREGAKVAIGGNRPKGLDRGWYVEPTLLVNATNNMRSSREEIFGPVGSVIRYRSVDEAIQIANDSNYGLSGAIFTSDAERGVELAGRIRTGTVGINSIGIDPAFPFGGYKDSGVGRQCGPESLEEYLETKTIALPGSSFLDHKK